MKFFRCFQKIRHLLEPEESNVYLSVGVAALFIGAYLIYKPLAFIVLGFIFIGIAFKIAEKESIDGTS